MICFIKRVDKVISSFVRANQVIVGDAIGGSMVT